MTDTIDTTGMTDMTDMIEMANLDHTTRRKIDVCANKRRSSNELVSMSIQAISTADQVSGNGKPSPTQEEPENDTNISSG